MQKLFNGQQSGMLAWTTRLIDRVHPKLPISVSVEGLYAPSRQPMDEPLGGKFERAVLEGYIRRAW
jgi:hypothetical protein